MSDVTQPAASFTEKWRVRWPTWPIAEIYLPATQREVSVAWFALLQEWMDAALAGEEPAPGLAKLAWWQEELRGWAKGARRHPLGAVLQAQPVDWTAIADALPVLREREALRGDAALAHMQPLSDAVAQAEVVLLGGAVDADALAADWLGMAGVESHGATATGNRGNIPRRLLHAMLEARNQDLPRWRLPLRFWRRAAGR